MDKYTWFANHEEYFGFTVIHTESDEAAVDTLIAVTDTAEKADFIAKACNLFNIEDYEKSKL